MRNCGTFENKVVIKERNEIVRCVSARACVFEAIQCLTLKTLSLRSKTRHKTRQDSKKQQQHQQRQDTNTTTTIITATTTLTRSVGRRRRRWMLKLNVEKRKSHKKEIGALWCVPQEYSYSRVTIADTLDTHTIVSHSGRTKRNVNFTFTVRLLVVIVINLYNVLCSYTHTHTHLWWINWFSLKLYMIQFETMSHHQCHSERKWSSSHVCIQFEVNKSVIRSLIHSSSSCYFAKEQNWTKTQTKTGNLTTTLIIFFVCFHLSLSPLSLSINRV